MVEKKTLCNEIRKEMIETVSKTWWTFSIKLGRSRVNYCTS